MASAGESLKSATETIFKENQKNVVEQMEKLKAEEKNLILKIGQEPVSGDSAAVFQALSWLTVMKT